MNDYLKDLAFIINAGSMDNTYKMAWVRSIVETCEDAPRELIQFDELSPLVFKYYWNQTIFFNLKQGPNVEKIPVIQKLVEDSIVEYQMQYGTEPKTFIKVQDKVEIPIEQISTILAENVSWRFLRVDKKHFENIYLCNRKERFLKIAKPELIKEYSDLLYQLINYRWSQKLEDLNRSPRISKKVRGVDKENKPKRKTLKPFHNLLTIENSNIECFITGEKIPVDKISIDHVIPWSYMYSDDLWNLVFVHSDLNSSKSNRLPDEEIIIRLDERNRRLLNLMKNSEVRSKHLHDLNLAVAKDYLRHHWIGFKG